MPLAEMIHENNSFVSYRFKYVAPITIGAFVPGVTMPIYVPNINLNAATKNIGNTSATRTEYSGTVSGGVTQLNSAQTISDKNFTNTVVDLRANTTFNNCRFNRFTVPRTQRILTDQRRLQ